MKLVLLMRLLAVVTGVVSATFLLFGLLDLLLFEQGIALDFLLPGMVISLLFAGGLRAGRGVLPSVVNRDALLLVAGTWTLFGLLSSIPFRLIGGLGWADAVFEAVSGVTTTGATVLVGLDSMPRALLMYRQFLQWTGGLGVIIFLVAIAPDLNVGGMRLFKLEVPGPMKEAKVVPRATNAARYLWGVYAMLTLLCACSYYLAGMGVYDAIAYSFSTIATGGFAPHDASIGQFHSAAVEWVAIVFMAAGGINFALHLGMLSHRRVGAYWRDEETRRFLQIAAAGGLLAGVQLWHAGLGDGVGDALRLGMLHAVSFMTGTGYVSGDMAHFPLALGFTMVILSYIGGWSGSTSGGMKVVRVVIAGKALAAEFRQILHPQAIITTKYQRQTVPANIFRSVFGFLFFYLMMSMLLIAILMIDGVDPWTAFTAVSATINCTGPAFGEASSNFIPLSDVGISTLSFAMLLGRMELMTILVLFTPAFWRA